MLRRPAAPLVVALGCVLSTTVVWLLAFHTGAVRSDRIRAVATFHGGGLVTKEADSPHLLIPKTKASFVVAIA